MQFGDLLRPSGSVTSGLKPKGPDRISNAVGPRWHVDNYRTRFLWIHAASLLYDERKEVVEGTFTADIPKAFDDVVVRYEPGHPSA